MFSPPPLTVVMGLMLPDSPVLVPALCLHVVHFSAGTPAPSPLETFGSSVVAARGGLGDGGEACALGEAQPLPPPPASSHRRAQGRAESRREEGGGGQPPVPLPEGQGRARHGQMLPGVERTAKGALPRALAGSWGHGPVSQLATEAAPAEPRLPRTRASRDTARRGQLRFRGPGVGAAAPQVWAGVLGGVWWWGDTGWGPGTEPFFPTPAPQATPLRSHACVRLLLITDWGGAM